MAMVAFRQHRPSTLEHLVDGTRETRAHALHPVRESLLAARFDDEVRVAVLERVVDDAEVRAFAGGEQCSAERANEALRAKRWDVTL